MFSLLTYFTFFVRRSFKNLVYKDICYKVSLKGMMISNLLKMSRKQAKYYSFSFFDGTKRYGTSFTGTDRISFLSSLANWLLVLESKTSSPLFLLLFFFHFSFFLSLFSTSYLCFFLSLLVTHIFQHSLSSFFLPIAFPHLAPSENYHTLLLGVLLSVGCKTSYGPFIQLLS